MTTPLIAIVDDDEHILAFFKIILEEQGYQVLTCTTATQALTCITRERPNLVILDLWLEVGVSGWDVCDGLARDPGTATIPIIICSAASPSRRVPPTHLQCHALAFLVKPFKLHELLTLVETALTAP